MDALLGKLSSANPIVTIIAVIIALAGAIVVIVNPETLSFKEYLDQMKYLLGFVAVGRGLAAIGSNGLPAEEVSKVEVARARRGR